jgi:SAM-dependent methyltransferase
MKRIVQPEFLDALSAADPRAIRSRRDLRRVNSWMGNADVLVAALVKARLPSAFSQTRPQITELGAGDGNFLLQIAQKIKVGQVSSLSTSPEVNATLLDRQKNVSAETRATFSKFGWRAETVVADVFDWPQGSEEIVIANLFLHHFENERLAELLRIISERAKLFIAIEPRRARLPLFFSRLLWVIGCNDVTRHDATVSVRAGFSDKELSALWPDKKNWRLIERRAGLFSHLFIAQKVHDMECADMSALSKAATCRRSPK